jgi:hypothetical protein
MITVIISLKYGLKASGKTVSLSIFFGNYSSCFGWRHEDWKQMNADNNDDGGDDDDDGEHEAVTQQLKLEVTFPSLLDGKGTL